MFPRTIIQATNHPILSTLSPAASRTSHGLTLPHLLVVVLTETLLPIIPSIDGASPRHHISSDPDFCCTFRWVDYTCLICTSIAYIPIRLRCSHLFCVRCLVKVRPPNSTPVHQAHLDIYVRCRNAGKPNVRCVAHQRFCKQIAVRPRPVSLRFTFNNSHVCDQTTSMPHCSALCWIGSRRKQRKRTMRTKGRRLKSRRANWAYQIGSAESCKAYAYKIFPLFGLRLVPRMC